MSGADNKHFFSEITKTEKALGSPFAVNLVPSRGSTAISNSGPFNVPSFSPIYNIGASSISPSPITTVPFIFILFSSLLMGSTAPLSAAILSFLPINFEAPIAAFSVALINNFKNFLSIDIYPLSILINFGFFFIYFFLETSFIILFKNLSLDL